MSDADRSEGLVDLKPGGASPSASLSATEALKRLDATIQRTAVVVRQLRSENERLFRQNRDLEQRLEAARLDAEQQSALRASLASGAGGHEHTAELAEKLSELEQQRREWIRDRRRLAERVEGILDKLEYLQSESTSN